MIEREQGKELLEGKFKEIMELLHEIYPNFDPQSPHNVDTPKRLAKTYVELFRGLDKTLEPNMTTFENFNCYVSNEWVVVKHIKFSSTCAHHWMPFFGEVSIAYIPSKRVLGLSKFARIVEYFSKRPQVQENFGQDIVSFLSEKLGTYEVMVVIRGTHTCMTCRGIESRDAEMTSFHYSLGDLSDSDVRKLVKELDL